MKLIIAGGRNYELTPTDYARLDSIHAQTPVTEVVSGAQTGADTCGEVWASRNNIPVRQFPYLSSHGKAGGPLRNAQMAQYADAVVLFPGNRGTASMYREARKAGLKVYDFRDELSRPMFGLGGVANDP